MCSPNRYQFSRKVYLFAEQIPFFQELCLCVHQTDTDFSGSTVLATEQIPIFQEHLYSHRTDTNFPEALFFGYRTDNDFPGAIFLLQNR